MVEWFRCGVQCSGLGSVVRGQGSRTEWWNIGMAEYWNGGMNE